MSIIGVNKDHLREHAGVKLVPSAGVKTPEISDPLVFWTLHPTHPVEVDLNEFAEGKAKKSAHGGKEFVPFRGRPMLTHQLFPALHEALLYATEGSVNQCLTALRHWWRIFDAVEAAAARIGQNNARVEEVQHVSQVHAEAAHRSGMRRTHFGIFRRALDVTRLALGMRETHWASPEDDSPEKHMPPEDQRKELRIAVKRECRQVLERWATCDELRILSSPPSDPQKAELWKHIQHMHAVQQRTGKALPSPNELNNGQHRKWTVDVLGVGLRALRSTAFPDTRDAHAVWHQCLINTPWNPSTLTSLDVSQRFLFDHFKDDQNDSHRRWVLVGQKERAGGKDQFVIGMWKSLDGPGHLIKTYMERVEPLREILKAELAEAEARYAKIVFDGDGAAESSKLFAKVALLKQGCRSVWLYINNNGEIDWIQESQRIRTASVDGRQLAYLDELCYLINVRRTSRGERAVPKVTPRDFRVWYADYVYRASHGSILAVKAALNHSASRTSVGYVNTNILNQEASNSARKFMEVLIDELDRGRIDLTILSHLYKFGSLTPSQEERLAQLRVLPKSREGIACKDAHHPPAHINATLGQACDVQRCLLCLENAVLLPESLDGIAMREAELQVLQRVVPVITWVEDRFDVELKNHKLALRRFDINHVMQARKKWSQAIDRGEHVVPGVPVGQSVGEFERI